LDGLVACNVCAYCAAGKDLKVLGARARPQRQCAPPVTRPTTTAGVLRACGGRDEAFGMGARGVVGCKPLPRPHTSSSTGALSFLAPAHTCTVAATHATHATPPALVERQPSGLLDPPRHNATNETGVSCHQRPQRAHHPPFHHRKSTIWRAVRARAPVPRRTGHAHKRGDREQHHMLNRVHTPGRPLLRPLQRRSRLLLHLYLQPV
jgi:hypothetical protein